ncbi:MAG: acetylornithine deacetylase, partial [Pseudomonadales bacterium]|nr:acetylornithine deacetylase [Pseudomonadales bacterium]
MSVAPSTREMIATLISTPSVSSTLARFDQSNLDVVHTLANWLEPLGFDIAIRPIESAPGKANLIASKGKGAGALVLSGHTD